MQLPSLTVPRLLRQSPKACHSPAPQTLADVAQVTSGSLRDRKNARVSNRKFTMKDRITIIVALLLFAMMTHPQRFSYRRLARANRWSALTRRRWRPIAVAPIVQLPSTPLLDAKVPVTTTTRR